jgi:hypothetical protein
MNANIVIGAAAIYTMIYNFAARRVLFDLKKVDPDYFEYLGASDGISGGNSVAIIKMIFDEDVPKRFYPDPLRKRFVIVRVMLALWPFVLIVGFFFL